MIDSDDPDLIRINERYALYSFRVGQTCCRYIIDLSKPGTVWVDRIVEDYLRWIPKEYYIQSFLGMRFLKGFGLSSISADQFFDNLMTNHPDVLEFLLFHPELL